MMARLASLKLNDKVFSAGLVKLDRKKIYGWTKLDIFDDEDQPCSLASISDGQHVLPPGSTALAGFNKKGEYVSNWIYPESLIIFDTSISSFGCWTSHKYP